MATLPMGRCVNPASSAEMTFAQKRAVWFLPTPISLSWSWMLRMNGDGLGASGSSSV